MRSEPPHRVVPATEQQVLAEAAAAAAAGDALDPTAELTGAQAQLVEDRLEGLLERMIVHQRARVLKQAQELNPRLTSEDVLQPHDYAELRESAPWNYEDGVLAGLMAAQIAVRAELRRGVGGPPPGPTASQRG